MCDLSKEIHPVMTTDDVHIRGIASSPHVCQIMNRLNPFFSPSLPHLMHNGSCLLVSEEFWVRGNE